MATQDVKEVTRGLEGGRAYLPPPTRISLYKDEHKELVDKVVGDVIDLQISGRIVEYDEEGHYRIELSNIKIVEENPKDKLVEKAESELINIGTLSTESLNAIFDSKPKG